MKSQLDLGSKLGMDFFQDDSGQKFLIIADYFSKFLFTFPCHINSLPKDAETSAEICFWLKEYHLLWWPTMDHPSTVKNSKCFAREFDFKHQTSSLHISINQMDSSRPWWKKWMPHTRRQMDLQMLKLEHCCSYVIHQSQKNYLLPVQRYYMDSPHEELSCPDVTDLSTY